MRMRNGIIAASAGLALVLAGTAAGASIASIPDSSGVIHACYQSPPPSGGANIQVIDTANGGKCSGGHVELTWNQTGPQGPAGAQGPSTAGPGGLSTEYVGNASTVACTSKASTLGWYGCPSPPGLIPNFANAVCPPDHPYVLGGGGYDTGGVPPANGPALSLPGTSLNLSAPGFSQDGTGVQTPEAQGGPPPAPTITPEATTTNGGTTAITGAWTVQANQLPGTLLMVWAICAK